MNYDPTRHRRRSIRLPAYDYAQAGAYFVTMVTHQRQCLFGEIVGGQMRLAAYGQVVSEQWLRSALVRGEIELDAFIVMPNHIHGIVIICAQPMGVGAHGRAPQLIARRGRWVRWSPGSNPPQRNASTKSGARWESRYGNATTTNGSSATTRN
jgi:REP element-mobilizing transposase RayT